MRLVVDVSAVATAAAIASATAVFEAAARVARRRILIAVARAYLCQASTFDSWVLGGGHIASPAPLFVEFSSVDEMVTPFCVQQTRSSTAASVAHAAQQNAPIHIIGISCCPVYYLSCPLRRETRDKRSAARGGGRNAAAPPLWEKICRLKAIPPGKPLYTICQRRARLSPGFEGHRWMSMRLLPPPLLVKVAFFSF